MERPFYGGIKFAQLGHRYNMFLASGAKVARGAGAFLLQKDVIYLARNVCKLARQAFPDTTSIACCKTHKRIMPLPLQLVENLARHSLSPMFRSFAAGVDKCRAAAAASHLEFGSRLRRTTMTTATVGARRFPAHTWRGSRIWCRSPR